MSPGNFTRWVPLHVRGEARRRNSRDTLPLLQTELDLWLQFPFLIIVKSKGLDRRNDYLVSGSSQARRSSALTFSPAAGSTRHTVSS